MKQIIIIFSCLVAFSCENKDIGTPCYHGKVIMSSCCSSSTFINIESPIHIGKSTTINGQGYSNVIQVPGYINGTGLYMNLRALDRDKDNSLFPPIRCYCLIAEGLDVPIYVITAVSTSACPGKDSRY